MARLTASGMVDMVRDYCAGETTETLNDTRLLRFLNQAYLYYAGKYPFPQLLEDTTVTTVSGTQENELSVSDVREISTITDQTNNVPMYEIDEKQYDQFTVGDQSNITGNPVYYFIDGVGSNGRWNLRWYPTPDGAYTIAIKYYENPPELVTSPTATSPIIPDVWDDVIMHLAASRGWMLLGNREKSMSFAGIAGKMESDLVRRSFPKSSIPRRTSSPVGRALGGV
jgi:hypothetical protein